MKIIAADDGWSRQTGTMENKLQDDTRKNARTQNGDDMPIQT